ncbi:trypsin-like peptidase domain-containing protein [Verrucomicrobiaceae bacterium R5-34]|nr:trypsin-like peptidase domain-containing protein [Verrucomicrobiaceae bacterium R5-34]
MFPRIKLPKLAAIVGLTSLIAVNGLQAQSSIDDLSDLKKLQSKVQRVAKKVMPATVSLFSTKNGASGSGVIVNREGLILTAGHVIRGAEEMTVILPDGTQTQGKVLGANYTRDAAMVQITDTNKVWPYAKIGSAKKLEIGDLVVALGHAGGFDAVRTPPVRFGRMIARGDNQFITTDCTLIGGDSGGPLFDLDGRVIGIHSSIGMSLSSNNHASIDGFLQDWKKLEAGKTWGRLGGSSMDDPDSPVIGVLTGDSERGGIVIRAAFEGGPAFDAGIRAGDILLSINGRRVTNLRALHAEIVRHAPGDVILVRLARGQQNITRKVKLGRRGDFQE